MPLQQLLPIFLHYISEESAYVRFYPHFAFDNALDTAILGKKGRSVKAVRALLDVDSLKGSADRSADIAKALDEAAKANPWAFGEDAGQTSAGTYSTGAAHGDPMHGEDDTDPVEAAFKTLNPTIKL